LVGLKITWKLSPFVKRGGTTRIERKGVERTTLKIGKEEERKLNLLTYKNY